MDGTSHGQLMVKLADIVERNQKVLATIEALDNGKPNATAAENGNGLAGMQSGAA